MEDERYRLIVEASTDYAIFGDFEVMERFSGARIDDFLPKPFRPDQLTAKVRGVLSAAVG